MDIGRHTVRGLPVPCVSLCTRHRLLWIAGLRAAPLAIFFEATRQAFDLPARMSS